ncbi:chemotaxis protein CheX, partial [candidate division KSB1 bacterium]
MPESLEQAAVEATQRVMETAAFLTVWPWSEEDGDLPLPDMAASMLFRGPCTGRLTLRVSSTLLNTITQNMLGELTEEDSPEEKGQDAVCEMLNMICGNLLTIWQGDEPVFNLNPPQVLNEDALAALPKPNACVSFYLEGTR